MGSFIILLEPTSIYHFWSCSQTDITHYKYILEARMPKAIIFRCSCTYRFHNTKTFLTFAYFEEIGAALAALFCCLKHPILQCALALKVEKYRLPNFC